MVVKILEISNGYLYYFIILILFNHYLEERVHKVSRRLDCGLGSSHNTDLLCRDDNSHHWLRRGKESIFKTTYKTWRFLPWDISNSFIIYNLFCQDSLSPISQSSILSIFVHPDPIYYWFRQFFAFDDDCKKNIA